jgi:hypothetical protein
MQCTLLLFAPVFVADGSWNVPESTCPVSAASCLWPCSLSNRKSVIQASGMCVSDGQCSSARRVHNAHRMHKKTLHWHRPCVRDCRVFDVWTRGHVCKAVSSLTKTHTFCPNSRDV